MNGSETGPNCLFCAGECHQHLSHRRGGFCRDIHVTRPRLSRRRGSAHQGTHLNTWPPQSYKRRLQLNAAVTILLPTSAVDRQQGPDKREPLLETPRV